jgi:hypothetical protein
MGRKAHEDFEERDEDTVTLESPAERPESSDLVEMIRRLEDHMTQLERKLDHLTALCGQGREREKPYYSKPFEKGRRRPDHGHSDRPFSHGHSRDDDERGGGHHKESDFSTDKPFGKPFIKSHGKPFGKPFGKPSGKPYGKPFGKSSGKPFPAKKGGKFHAGRSRRDA